MPIRNKTRGRYESQTAEERARRNDKSTYEFEKCPVCGGTIVIWNGKRGDCAMCELKRDKEAEELDKEFAKALQIVLDNSFTPEVAPWDVIPDSSDTSPIVTVTKTNRPRWILSRSWADKHLNSDADLKYFDGGAIIK